MNLERPDWAIDALEAFDETSCTGEAVSTVIEYVDKLEQRLAALEAVAKAASRYRASGDHDNVLVALKLLANGLADIANEGPAVYPFGKLRASVGEITTQKLTIEPMDAE